MITPLKLIVLNTRPYRETSLLVNAYTDIWGRADFIVRGIRTARNKAAAAMFHPLSILDTRTYYHEKKDLNQLKEYQKIYLLDGLCSDVRKSSVGLFIGELLYKTVRESEENRALFGFVADTILELDRAGVELADLHLYFAARLCRYLGYAPDLSAPAQKNIFFDIRPVSGIRQTLHTGLLIWMPPGCSGNRLSSGRSDSNARTKRHHFLNCLMTITGNMGKTPDIRSVDILHQVFFGNFAPPCH